MINRPPTPIDVLEYVDWLDELYCIPTSVNIEQSNAMQEAITAEWLIEYGFMPDPSRAVMVWEKYKIPYPVRIIVKWVCEDKTQ
jgi:hypothetical protein